MPQRQTSDSGLIERFPKQFGDFVLEKALWRGAHSTVYQARDIRNSALVALKVLYPTAENPLQAQYAAAESEVGRLRELSHPNIISLRESGTVEGIPFIAFPFIHGGSIDIALKKGSVSLSVTLQVTVTVAQALHAAHSAGIIHRDLKPRNILVDDDKVPHVLDWGLSWKQGGKSSASIQSIIGTPAYMSPEQARGQEKQLTAATDIYSLGAILYELLTGRPPFVAETAWKTMQMAMSMTPEAPSSLDASIDPALDRVVLTCLEKDPNGRYATAATMAEDLQRILSNQPPRGRPSFLGRLFS